MPKNREVVRERLDLAGDALVVTSGLFAWLACIMVAMTMAGWDMLAAEAGGAGALGILASVLSLVMMFAGAVGGPVLVWWLHGRKASWLALLGAVVAAPLVVLTAAVLAPALSAVLGLLLKPLTDWEFAGAVALLVLLAICYVTAIVRTMFAHRPAGERRQLLHLRWISAGGMVVLAALVTAALLTGVTGEMGEALIFGMMFGAGAAAMVTGADLADRLGHGKATPAAPALGG